MAEHPAHALVRELSRIGDELAGSLGNHPGDIDFGQLFAGLEIAARRIDEAVGSAESAFLAAVPRRAGVSVAIDELRNCLSRGNTEGLGYAAHVAREIAARETLAQQADRQARLVEAAWMAGAEACKAGHPLAAVTREDGGCPAWNDGPGTELAASLGVLDSTPAERDAALSAYLDGHAEEAGQPAPAGDPPGRYLPGQQVTTALGRPGILTGDAGRGGGPRVLLHDGLEVTVPREALTGPLAHLFRTQEEASAAAARAPAVADGDILIVLADRGTWIKAGWGLAAADEATLTRDLGRYEPSVRMAIDLVSPAAARQPGACTSLGFPVFATAILPAAGTAPHIRKPPAGTPESRSPAPLPAARCPGIPRH